MPLTLLPVLDEGGRREQTVLDARDAGGVVCDVESSCLPIRCRPRRLECVQSEWNLAQSVGGTGAPSSSRSRDEVDVRQVSRPRAPARPHPPPPLGTASGDAAAASSWQRRAPRPSCNGDAAADWKNGHRRTSASYPYHEKESCIAAITRQQVDSIMAARQRPAAAAAAVRSVRLDPTIV